MSSGPPPAWLFSNNNSISPTIVTKANTKMSSKDKKNRKPKATPLSPETSTAGAPPAQLMDMVEDFLSKYSFTSAHGAFKKQREKKGWAMSDKIATPISESLTGVFEAWDSTRPQAASNKAESRASSDSDNSSDSDSSSDESDADDVAMKDAEGDASSSSSSGSSSSSSDSEDEEPETKPAVRATKSLKRKAPPVSSSSEASSDSSSDDDSSNSSVPENEPKQKKQKVEGANSARSTSSASSSSTSDSDSGSGTSSDSEADAEDAAKVPLPDSDDSSESSSSDASDSDSDFEATADSQNKETVPTIKDSSDSSVTLEKSPNLKATNLPPLPPDPVFANERKGKKKQNEAFSRIPKNIKVNPKFASNAYVAVDYSQRAHEDLIVTKGKGFTKEKNKKKRGSYRGGPIDISHNGAVYFDD